MKISKFVRAVAFVAVAGGAVVSTGSSAQAGLFDFLFGGGYQRPAPQYYDPGSRPLDVRVSPQRRKAADRPRVVKERTTKVVNKAIDPKTHPNWYLEDTTLRRGDIIVLPTGVMVYQGGPKPQTREDFSHLSESRLVSKKERERIQLMAGPPSVTTAETSDATKGKEATAASNPVQ